MPRLFELIKILSESSKIILLAKRYFDEANSLELKRQNITRAS